jgi:hypothetical protein
MSHAHQSKGGDLKMDDKKAAMTDVPPPLRMHSVAVSLTSFVTHETMTLIGDLADPVGGIT